MILLPSLIKAAIGFEDLDYQVAPGLSETPTDMYGDLDLAGARVAYLLDEDEGGHFRRKQLVAGGVPEERIVPLGALTLENLLDPEAYLAVLRTLFAECNPGLELPELPTLPDQAESVWPQAVRDWAKEHNLREPGKRAVAARLVEEGFARPSEFGAVALQTLHRRLEATLKRTSASGEQEMPPTEPRG